MILHYSSYFIIIAGVFAAAWLVQMFLQLMLNFKVLRCCKHQKQQYVSVDEAKPGVSIVIYANNQGEVLKCNLPLLLDVDYPNFEVIVVDDMSTDETLDVLTVMEQRSEYLFHTKITDKVRTMSHRKLALLLGVKAAPKDIIVTTTANCIPATRNWLNALVRQFGEKTDIVIGPMVFESRVGLIRRFCQYDLFQRMITMFGVALSFRAFAGWGSNMAFRKAVLFADNNKAFSSHLNIKPGEDDLMVSAMARKDNIGVACSTDALMVSKERPLVKAWSKDRVNRAFTAKRYGFVPTFFKCLDYSTRYLCVFAGLALATLAAMSFDWIVLSAALLLLVARMITNVSLAYCTSKELGIHRYVLSPVIYDLVIPVVDLVFWIRASVRNKTFYVSRV